MARFIPALRFDALTRFYDPVVALTTRERTFKRRLVEQVALQRGHRVADVGCGTGTLTIMLKRSCESADVIGIDGDPKTLAMARLKALSAKARIEFSEGLAWSLGLADCSVERVTSSLLLHHLDSIDKARTLAEMFRVLVPGGEVHIADWGQPHGPVMRVAFLGVQLLDGFETTTANVRGLLPMYITRAGFERVEETTRFRTPLGSISLYRAVRPR